MPTTTTNYGWQKPTVGGDTDTWGSELDATIDAIDAQAKTNHDLAAAALPASGGAMTGRLDVKTATMQRVDKGTVSGATALDLAVAQVFTLTVGGATTLSFSNVPAVAGEVIGVLLKITNGGANVTWPAQTKWPGGTAPTLTVSGVDDVALVSYDGGASWHGVVVGKAFA